MDAPLSCSSCDYTSIFALTATKGPPRPAEVLDAPLAPQGTPSARTAKETKGNGGFRAVLVARYREMPCWELQEGRFLVHLMEILCILGSQPGNLLLHDGHTRPDLVDLPGLAGNIYGRWGS